MARMGALTKTPPLRGKARKEFRAAKDAALAAGEAIPSQDKFRPKQPQQPRPMARPQQTGQTLAGAVAFPGAVGNQIGMLQPGQSPADVAGAVASGIAAQPQQGAWWQQQQQFGPPSGSLPMTKPGMPAPENAIYYAGGSATFNEGNGGMWPQMPQPSANHGGQYRLSPGIYGTQQQAMEQYNQQMRQRMPGLQNGLGQSGNVPVSNWGPIIPYGQRRG